MLHREQGRSYKKPNPDEGDPRPSASVCIEETMLEDKQ